jgi:hypothetical protein
MQGSLNGITWESDCPRRNFLSLLAVLGASGVILEGCSGSGAIDINAVATLITNAIKSVQDSVAKACAFAGAYVVPEVDSILGLLKNAGGVIDVSATSVDAAIHLIQAAVCGPQPAQGTFRLGNPEAPADVVINGKVITFIRFK